MAELDQEKVLDNVMLDLEISKMTTIALTS